MNEDEITKLKLMICYLDLSVKTKEKLYNQAHKIRKQLQQKENVIKEVREKIKDKEPFYSDWYDREIILFDEEDKKELLEILGSDK